MINLKKYILRHFTKIKVLRSTEGRIRLKISNASKIPKEGMKYMHYLNDAIAMLEGIEKVSFNDAIGTILIEYDINKVYEARILKWLDRIIEIGIDNFELIKDYGSHNLEYVEKTLQQQLEEAVKHI